MPLKIDIWSDITCPFCYIGKARLDQALKESGIQEKVIKTWHSFLIDPDIKTGGSRRSIYAYHSERKGISYEEAENEQKQLERMASDSGLVIHSDKIIVANTRKAHLILQVAKKHQRSDMMEEILFRAYFQDGLRIDDEAVLTKLAEEAGLKPEWTRQAFDSDTYSFLLDQDLTEAKLAGISTVPFFVFDSRFAISGAQPVSDFMEAIHKAQQKDPG